MKFTEAMQFLARKSVMPTALRSWALQELPVELLKRAFFSAGVEHAAFLQEGLDAVEAIVNADLDRATARVQLRDMLDRLGYRPDPTEAGSLTDLSSDRRLNLILDTNAAQARAYGREKVEDAPEIRHAYPAAELVIVGAPPEVPRKWKTKLWPNAGGKLYEGRMIARKDDPIWTKPISAGGFNRFGNRYGPYDFNSTRRKRPVDRATAIRLGVIESDTEIAPFEEGLNDNLSASAKRIASPELLRAIRESGIATIDSEGRFVPSL